MFNLNNLDVMSDKVIIEIEGDCGDFITLAFDSVNKGMIIKTLAVYKISLTEEQLENYCY